MGEASKHEEDGGRARELKKNVLSGRDDRMRLEGANPKQTKRLIDQKALLFSIVIKGEIVRPSPTKYSKIQYTIL